MLNSYSMSQEGKKTLPFFLQRAYLMRGLIMTMELLITGMCLINTAFSQGNSGNVLTYKDTVDIIGGNFKINKLNITQKQAADTSKYKVFLKKYAGDKKELWPYFPYMLVNPMILPEGPLRFYVGKQTTGLKEYVLIAVKAKAYKGRQPRGQTINYVDDSPAGLANSGLLKNTGGDWISIRLSRRSQVNDSVFYSKISKQVATKYIKNFTGKTSAKAFQRRYKHSFVVTSTKDMQGRLLLQPVVKTPKKKKMKPAANSGSNNKAGKSEDDEIIQFEGNNVCCLSPPEGGSSVNPLD